MPPPPPLWSCAGNAPPPCTPTTTTGTPASAKSPIVAMVAPSRATCAGEVTSNATSRPSADARALSSARPDTLPGVVDRTDRPSAHVTVPHIASSMGSAVRGMEWRIRGGEITKLTLRRRMDSQGPTISSEISGSMAVALRQGPQLLRNATFAISNALACCVCAWCTKHRLHPRYAVQTPAKCANRAHRRAPACWRDGGPGCTASTPTVRLALG
jgi:hypothetical protein